MIRNEGVTQAAMDNETIYVQWSDDGQHIRKYSRNPFDGAETFIRHQSGRTGASLASDGGGGVDYMDIAAAFGPVLKDGFPKASPMFRMAVAEALADEVRKREHWFRSVKPPTTKPHDDLIEQAVQAVLDAGLAENGEQGVGAARHAARFICEQREYWREYEKAQLADEIRQIGAARSTPLGGEGRTGAGEALREALTKAIETLAASRHLIGKYCPDHHWLPEHDQRIADLRAALSQSTAGEDGT